PFQPGTNIVPAPGSATATLTNPNAPANAPSGTMTSSGIVPPSAINQMFPPTAQGAGVQAIHTANATVTADVNTNSIIVIAPPSVQQMYAELIKKLDERRPQVQIECSIVTIDTSDSFQLAVDVSKLGGFGANQVLTFSSFGVSTVDVNTGGLTPKVNPGGTFALLGPDIANVVINALASNTRARLIS